MSLSIQPGNFRTAGASPLMTGLIGPRAAANAAEASSGAVSAAAVPTAADELRKLANMSLAERIRASVLKDMGLSEDDLKGMSSDEREKIEAKIEELVKSKLESESESSYSAGSLLDVHA